MSGIWKPPLTISRSPSHQDPPPKTKVFQQRWAPTFVVGGKVPKDDKEKYKRKEPASLPKQASNLIKENYLSLSNRSFLVSESESETKIPRSYAGRNENLVLTNDEEKSSGNSVSDDVQETQKEKWVSMISKINHSQLVDKTTQETRWEWTEQIVKKSLRSYENKLAASNPDLPEDFQSDDEMEDSINEDEVLISIRDDMLNDPNLTEREIVCFFEGARLFKMKFNSLQRQIDGAKATEKITPRSVAISGSTVASSSMVKPRSMIVKRDDYPLQLNSVGFSRDDKIMSPFTRKKVTTESDDLSPQDNVDVPKSKTARTAKSLRLLSIQRIRRDTPKEGHSDIRKLLEQLEEAENRQKKLEKQLAQAGVVIAEDIPYDVAKEKVGKIAARMGEIGSSNVADKELREEYFRLEQDMEKYSTALQLTDEWSEEQEELERQWEESVATDNEEAIKQIRRHMPVEVRNMSETVLSTQPGPTGKVLPRTIAKKFKRTNILQILRIDPDDVSRMHPSTLENMRVTGLTLTERRAIYHHLKEVGPRWKSMQADKMVERKWAWFTMMRSNLKENVGAWQRHVNEYGPPGNHRYATRDSSKCGCPLIGKQCPFRADKVIDYDNDFGYPPDAIYFISEVKKTEIDNTLMGKQEATETFRDKKSHERSAVLKNHYKGKILQMSLANGSCELMDNAVDKVEAIQGKWARDHISSKEGDNSNDQQKQVAAFSTSLNDFKLAILQIVERSGIQLIGKRDADADKPDIRSVIEISLCEEIIETGRIFFNEVEGQMEELKIRDGRVKSTIKQLESLLNELHERNLNSIEALGGNRLPRSRPLRTKQNFLDEIRKESVREKKVGQCALEGRYLNDRGRWGRKGVGRGGFLDAIADGRGRKNERVRGNGDILHAIDDGSRGRGGGALLAARGGGCKEDN